jgi:DNA anti-recombination protein RmuC
MFGYLKIAIILIVISGVGGVYVYVKTLKADLATSEANNAKLEQSVEQQKAVIEQQLKDAEEIRVAMKEQTELNERLNASLEDLRDKFHKVNASGKKRDIGELAESKPGLMERVINTGTRNALRCMEISMGAPLTEDEKNATKKSEINPECWNIANPSYQPYGD